jgi:hypothetical protein
MRCPVCNRTLKDHQRYCSSACGGRSQSLPIKERFWNKVVFNHNGCWLWTGGLTHGYGRIRHNGKTPYVHRLAWEWKNGPIPEELEVDHLCEVRHCVNHDHMILVTKHEHGKHSARQRWRTA